MQVRSNVRRDNFVARSESRHVQDPRRKTKVWANRDRKHRASILKIGSLLIEQISVGQYKNFSYLVADTSTREAAIFDPAWEVPKLLAVLQEKGLELKYIVN